MQRIGTEPVSIAPETHTRENRNKLLKLTNQLVGCWSSSVKLITGTYGALVFCFFAVIVNMYSEVLMGPWPTIMRVCLVWRPGPVLMDCTAWGRVFFSFLTPQEGSTRCRVDIDFCVCVCPFQTIDYWSRFHVIATGLMHMWWQRARWKASIRQCCFIISLQKNMQGGYIINILVLICLCCASGILLNANHYLSCTVKLCRENVWPSFTD